MTNSFARALVVLNSSSGSGSAEGVADNICTRLREAGVDVRALTLAGDVDLPVVVQQAVDDGCTVVIAGGGDGTVNAVANACRGHRVAMGVLPLGTLNHFARDLGIPVELDPALQVILAGHTVPVDAAEVNGQLFLNNSSVGLYPRIVRLRERYRGRRLFKWVVAAWATWRVTRQGRELRVQLRADDVDVTRTTPLVFVGNNPYRMEGFEAGSRESLHTGALGLYVVKTSGQWKLLRLVWRILARTAQRSGELAMLTTTSAVIDLSGGGAGQVEVATDGELVTLDLPLSYRSLPGELMVFVPR